LKTFLTQFGSALPLTPDPPVIYFWKWIGWKDYEVPENRNLESVSTKNIILLSPTRRIPAPDTRRAHPFPSLRAPARCSLTPHIRGVVVVHRNALEKGKKAWEGICHRPNCRMELSSRVRKPGRDLLLSRQRDLRGGSREGLSMRQAGRGVAVVSRAGDPGHLKLASSALHASGEPRA
jgi:hypothetical protein